MVIYSYYLLQINYSPPPKFDSTHFIKNQELKDPENKNPRKPTNYRFFFLFCVRWIVFESSHAWWLRSWSDPKFIFNSQHLHFLFSGLQISIHFFQDSRRNRSPNAPQWIISSFLCSSSFFFFFLKLNERNGKQAEERPEARSCTRGTLLHVSDMSEFRHVRSPADIFEARTEENMEMDPCLGQTGFSRAKWGEMPHPIFKRIILFPQKSSFSHVAPPNWTNQVIVENIYPLQKKKKHLSPSPTYSVSFITTGLIWHFTYIVKVM